MRLVPVLRKFQSPSLRGSGRFTPIADVIGVVTAGFNPLHCGAVVASIIALVRFEVKDLI